MEGRFPPFDCSLLNNWSSDQHILMFQISSSQDGPDESIGNPTPSVPFKEVKDLAGSVSDDPKPLGPFKEGKILSLSADVSGLKLKEGTVTKVEGRVVAVTVTQYYSDDNKQCVQLVTITLVKPPTPLDSVEVSCSIPPPTKVDDYFITVGNLVYIHGKNTDPLLGVFVMDQGQCTQRVYGDREYGVFEKKFQAKLNKEECEKVLSDRKPKIFTKRRPPAESNASTQKPSQEILPRAGRILSLSADVSGLKPREETLTKVEGRVVAVTVSQYYSDDNKQCVQLVTITLVKPPTPLDSVEVSCSIPPPTKVDDYLITVGNLVYIHGKNTDPLLGVFVMDQGQCTQRVYGDREYGVFKKKFQAKLNKEECEKVLSDRKPKIFTKRRPPAESNASTQKPSQEILPRAGRILSLSADVSGLKPREETVTKVEGRVVAVTVSQYYSDDNKQCVQLVTITLVKPPTPLDSVEVSCSIPPPTKVDDYLITVGNLVYIHGKNTDPLLGVFVMDQGQCTQRVYGDREYGVFKKKFQAKLNKEECEKVLSDRKPKIFTNQKPPAESNALTQKLSEEFLPKVGRIINLEGDVKGFTADPGTLVTVRSHVVSVTISKYYKDKDCVQLLNLNLNRPLTLLDSVVVSCDIQPPKRMDDYLINVGNLAYFHGRNIDPLLGVFVMNPNLCYQRVYGDREFGVYKKKIHAHLYGGECQQVLTTRKPMVFSSKENKPPSTQTQSNLKNAPTTSSNTETTKRSAADIDDYTVIHDQKVVVLNGDTYSFQKDTSSPEVVVGQSFEFSAQRYVRADQCFQLVTVKKRSNAKVYDRFKITCAIIPPFRVKKFGLNYGNIIIEDGDFELVLVVKDGTCVRRSYWLAGDTVDKKDLVLMDPECTHITKKARKDRCSGVIPELKEPDVEDYDLIKRQKVVILNRNIFGYKPIGRLRYINGRKLRYRIMMYQRGEECVKLVTISVTARSDGVLDQLKVCCSCDQQIMRWGKRFNIGYIMFEDEPMSMVFVVKDGNCVRRRYSVNAEDDLFTVDEALTDETCDIITQRTKSERSSGILPYEIKPDDSDFQLVKDNKVVVLDGNVFGYRQLKNPLKIQGSRFKFDGVKYTVGNKRACIMLITISQLERELVFDEVKVSCDTNFPNKLVGEGLKIDGIIFEEPPRGIVYVVRGGLCIRRLYRVVDIDVARQEVVLDEGECYRITKRSKEDRMKGVFPDRLPPPSDDYQVIQSQKVAVLSRNVNGYSGKGTETSFKSENYMLTMQEYTKGEECVKLVRLTRNDYEDTFDIVKISCDVAAPYQDDNQDLELNFGNVIYVLDYNRVLYVIRDGRCVIRSYWVGFGEVNSIDRLAGNKECSKITRWTLEERSGEAKLNKEAPIVQENVMEMKILSLKGSLAKEYMPLDIEETLGRSTFRLALKDHYWDRCVRVAILYYGETELDRVLVACGPHKGVVKTQESLQYQRTLAVRRLASDTVEALYNNGDITCTKRLYKINSAAFMLWKNQVTKTEEKISSSPCMRLISGRKRIWAVDSDKKETTKADIQSDFKIQENPEDHQFSHSTKQQQ